ncbi:MAG: hypothetical protein ACTH30_10590 [Leucobacter sp.]
MTQNKISDGFKEMGKDVLAWMLPKNKAHRYLLYGMAVLVLGVYFFG